MAPQDHTAHIVGLVNVILVLKNTINPAADRNTLQIHQGFFLAVGSSDVVEPGLHPVQVFTPDTRPVCPCTCGQAIVTGQCVGQHAHIRCALNIVVAAENVGAATAGAHVAKGQLQNAIGAGIVVAVGMLGATHAPDQGAGAVVGQRAGNPLHL